MMKSALVIALLLLSHAAHAAQCEVLFRAAHYDTAAGQWSHEFNDGAHGVGVTVNNWGLGVYENSFRRTTIYAVRRIPATSWAGIEVGAATGYQNLFGNTVQPLVVGYVQFHHIKVRVIPGQVVAFGVPYYWER